MEYSEYKDTNVSYIGSVPFSWKIAKIKNISEFMPKADLSSLCPEDEVTFAPMECIKKGHFENHSRKLKDIDGSYTQFAEGDIVFAKVTPCFENGNLSIMNNLFSGVGFGSSELFVLRPTHLLDRYLFYFLQHNGFINAACATMTGTGGLKRVSSDFVKNCFIPIPSSDEQSSIADYLDRKVSRIDSIIEEARASIEEYKAWKSSIVYKAVTKGLDPTAEMKDSGVEWIGEIPSHWEHTALKNICTMQAGRNLVSEQISDSGVYPVYGGNGIRGYYTEYNTDGEFLTVGRQGALCGNVHSVSGKIWATEHAVITRCKHNTILDYLYYLLIAMNLNQYAANTAAQPGLAVSVILNISTVLPPIDEQKSIAVILNDKCSLIDSLISEKESLITDLEAYKKSLIFEVVTGKRKVV